MTVLIAGCGDLGTEAGLRYAAAGHRVVGWRRSPGRLPEQLEGRAVDLTGTLPEVPADTDTVVIATAAGERTEAAYRAAYVSATANLLDALERDGVSPRRILFVSSTAVYGDFGGGPVDEHSPAEPGTPTGRILREAERLLLERSPAALVLRLSGIYGPGRTRLIDSVSSGRAVLPAEPQWTNRIHRDDAAAAIVHLTTAVEAPAPVYLGTDEEPSDLADVLRFLAAELRLPAPPAGPTSTTRGGDKRCSSALLRSTGFGFTYPTYREGYRAVLAGEGVRHP
ncbi:NAD-dependent epimerase/dehydratase family protein [Arthrobacter crusticola]|uniref:NAD-dependent epimerase/dehydratase family protein n=1 Tax=Arthrobacter crusticola TaxID=2547960 RepID=A0A4R5TZS1_9MICC|nr:NAD-dependent epimerase/dehydratase family protein [Arthrobacter crusticola]TDK26701.1 NAD-dependent epimerase/dehydratase family protein [Arthrobacter crusticola]